MNTWTEDRLSDYYAFYEEWPEEITRGEESGCAVAVSAGCIKEPDSKATPILQTGFNFNVTSKFSMLKTEFERINLNMTDAQKRPRFSNHGVIWQIYRVNDDSPVDPIVDFWAGRKQ